MNCEDQRMLNYAARASMGIFPQSINGVERTPWQEGWTSYALEQYDYNATAYTWFQLLSSQQQDMIRPLLNSTINLDIIKDKEGKFTTELSVNCSDLFFWGTADSEEISLEEVPDLIAEIAKNPGNGSEIWAVKKRKLPPQEPILNQWKELGIWTEELEQIVRNE
jgi:hypothetical protein